MITASRELARSLVPVREAQVRLLVPLFVDTFPLGHFYAFGNEDGSEAEDLVSVVDWDDERSILRLLERAKENGQPMGVYLPQERVSNLRKRIAGLPNLNNYFDLRDEAVSTFYLRWFFADAFETSARGSCKEATTLSWLESCKDVEKIIVHSDVVSLAKAGGRYLYDCLENLSGDWSTRPDIVPQTSDLPFSLFSPDRRQHLRHAYWFSELGLTALRKTAHDFLQLAVPTDAGEWKEHRLHIGVFFPTAIFSLKQQDTVLSSLNEFHNLLFSFSEQQLTTAFENVWKVFMSFFVTRWPIFNLFESSREYTACFLEHHERLSNKPEFEGTGS